MKIKHTPGPWFFDHETHIVTTKDRIATGLANIAIVDVDWIGPLESEQQANANLIAAAPEMYLHLAECAASLRYYAARKSAKGEAIASMMDRDLIDRIEALLDKAAGQTHEPAENLDTLTP